MYQINFSKPIHIHFIGIGGISMSGLARLLKTRGFTVSGSDWTQSALTDELTALGIPVALGQRAENITPDIGLVVYTAAVSPENEELVAARNAGIPTLVRADLLGQIMKHYPHAVGIAGTHGKTTTTSLLSMLLLNGGLDPTVSVGGIVDAIGGNLRIGCSDYFIAEACEYTNTFLSLFPTDAIILNIEEDHLDFFKDIDDIRASFAKYIALVPAGGTVCINAEIDNYRALFDGASCEAATYGILEDTTGVESTSSYDYAAANISYDENGCGSYDLIVHDKYICRISLAIPGKHNISNSLPAIALAMKYGVGTESIQATLATFHGTKRRFEYKGSLGGIRIYDDYAHHPTEIRATLTAAQSFDCKRIITVFQPHTYTRTKALLPEFAEALSLSDVIVLADIYAAREKSAGQTVSSADLEERLSEKGKEVYYFHSFDEIKNFLLRFFSNGDMLITMGAGDIVNVGESLLEN